jgi:hypothetical protein
LFLLEEKHLRLARVMDNKSTAVKQDAKVKMQGREG